MTVLPRDPANYGASGNHVAGGGPDMRTDYVVGDLMTIDPVVIAPAARLEEAARILDAFEVSGLPVVDAQGQLVGVISQTDLLRGADEHGPPVRGRWADRRVADIMSSPPITVRSLTPLAEAARLMRERSVHRLVVVDEGDRAIGVLSSMDFVALYAED